jgi:hypothetical protein
MGASLVAQEAEEHQQDYHRKGNAEKPEQDGHDTEPKLKDLTGNAAAARGVSLRAKMGSFRWLGRCYLSSVFHCASACEPHTWPGVR